MDITIDINHGMRWHPQPRDWEVYCISYGVLYNARNQTSSFCRIEVWQPLVTRGQANVAPTQSNTTCFVHYYLRHDDNIIIALAI